MSYSRSTGRKEAVVVPPGKPVMYKADRNAERAYAYQQNKAAEGNWAEAREFEERPRAPRGPTARSSQFKERIKQRKSQPKRDEAAASYDFRAKDETSPIDEPLYDLGPHTSSIPVQETYSQNYDFSGYIDQVERTYEQLRGIDPRLDKRLPFSMFQHSMCTVLNCYLLDLTLDNGERKLGHTRCQDLLPEDLVIPDNLYNYMATIGNTTAAGGEEVKFNLPDTAVPQAALDNVPAGSFGELNANNHNVYECYISPLVTSNRVLNSRRAQADPEVPPLPLNLIPPGAQPTLNLLGHGPPDIVPAEARPRILGFEFPDGDSVSARLRICPELMARVNTVLFELNARFKMRNIERESPTMRKYIIPKNMPGNIQFVRVTEQVPDHQRLSTYQNQIRCSTAFGSATAGLNNC